MARVVITGMGCITAMGKDVGSFRENLFAGRSGIRTMPEPRAGLHFTRAATVEDFRPEEWLLSAQRAIADRSSAFAIAAAREAAEQSGIVKAHAAETIAVVFGCSAGGRLSEEQEAMKLYTRDARVHPLTVPRTMANAGTSMAAMEHGLTGPSLTLSTACASAGHAIGLAFQMVRAGSVRAALAGGHEAPLSLAFLRAWDSLKVVSPTACRPFARDRDGMTLGEGAAVLALESLEAAQARGAEILGEIAGFGMTSDAHHMTQPDPAGPAAAMRRALEDAGATSDEVGYINAHGTGTDANDRAEAEAVYRVFGERARTLPISSTKGLHGHAIGASGAIELLATVLALREGVLPANGCLAEGGVFEPDPALGLGGLVRVNEASRPGLALSNSFAFGGMNAVLALRG
ncbi:MAG TPA: beta-ketoacyl-[acyl-carrier-protein] synthase family protein [Acidobacteriaceae bacterium]|jgi:3-oxoacyl-[acyl-carrier-protein] synthase II/nodulation protein E|nr:beta-ketoacyl-[acyl-carrier-protein] synthase family protein [Acidobacteriaceae bacterium]